MHPLYRRTLLPAWGLLSLTAIHTLPQGLFVALTPWVCGLLLSLIGLVLALALRPYFSEHRNYRQAFITVAIAAGLAPPAGLLFGLALHTSLTGQVAHEMAVLVWLLSSLGLLLTSLVARLLHAIHHQGLNPEIDARSQFACCRPSAEG